MLLLHIKRIILQQISKSMLTENKLGKLSVLVAEDSTINALFITTILGNWGFDLTVAVNGNEVVEMVKQKDFDLILMDIQMPEKNGIEATIDIRQMEDEKKKNIPIIALTANGLIGFEKNYFESGMNDYLTKPFREKTLYEVIEKVMVAK